MSQTFPSDIGHDAVIYSEVSRKERAAIYLFDLMAWGTLSAAAHSVAVEIGFHHAAIFDLVLYLSYFVVVPAVSKGQTFGKFLAGLQVVPSDLKNAQNNVSFFRLLVRETLGRLLSLGLFGFGFLVAFYREDRRGWHDQLSGTRVTSIDEIPAWASKARIAAWWGGSLATLSCLAHIVLFSPWPLQEALRYVQKSEMIPGLKFEDLGGGALNGFKIGRVEFVTRFGRHVFEDGWIQLRINRQEAEIRIEVVTAVAKKVRLLVPGQPEEFEKRAITQIKDLITTGLVSRWDDLGIPIIFEIGAVDLTNVEVASFGFPQAPAIPIERIYLERLIVAPQVAAASVSRIYFRSSRADFDMSDLSIEGSFVKFNKRAHLSLKPEWAPRWIRKPIDVGFEGQLNEGKFQSLKLEAFGGAVKARFTGERGELVTTRFTPMHFLKTEVPFFNLDLMVRGSLNPFKIKSLGGEVSLRSARFKVEQNGTLFMPRENVWYSVQLRPQAFEDAFEDFKPDLNKAFVITMNNGGNVDVQDALAQLYFGAPVKSLQADQLAYIQHDEAFFSSGSKPGSLPGSVPGAVSGTVPKPSSSDRQPTGDR